MSYEELIGKTLVEVSPDFYRPTDVVNLWGPTSPLSCNVFPIPTAHDCILTTANKIIDSIPDTSFQVFISFFLSFSFDKNLFLNAPHVLYIIALGGYTNLSIPEQMFVDIYNWLNYNNLRKNAAR